MSKNSKKSTKLFLSPSLPLIEGIYEIQKRSEQTKRNFIEAVDMILVINRSLVKSEALLRGTVSLPHGTGKISDVVVFTKDSSQRNTALLAGATQVGAEDLILKIESTKVKFDFCLAASDSMALISKVAKKLGPRGLMPNQKDGTLVPYSQEIVEEFVKNRVRYKSTKFGVVQCRIGSVSQSAEVLKDNLIFAYKAIASALSGNSRLDLFASKYIKSTMGNSQKITIEL